MNQIILTSLSSSGTGKTTNFAQIAYFVAKAGYRVALIELDERNSLKKCCGLPDVEPNQSTSAIFQEDFQGDYPFLPLWQDHLKGKAQVVQAERESQEKTIADLAVRQGAARSLTEILNKHPLDDFDLIILDCPGQAGVLTNNAILAATHVLLGIEVTEKCFEDVVYLFEYLYRLEEEYKIQLPVIAGFLVGRFDVKGSFQRDGFKQLLREAQELGIKLFNPIRQSNYFLYSYSLGVPLKIHAPKFAGNKDYTDKGNFFKRKINDLKSFEPEFKKLTAIVPYLIEEIKR